MPEHSPGARPGDDPPEFLPKGALVFTVLLLLLNVVHWLSIYLTLLARGLP